MREGDGEEEPRVWTPEDGFGSFDPRDVLTIAAVLSCGLWGCLAVVLAPALGAAAAFGVVLLVGDVGASPWSRWVIAIAAVGVTLGSIRLLLPLALRLRLAERRSDASPWTGRLTALLIVAVIAAGVALFVERWRESRRLVPLEEQWRLTADSLEGGNVIRFDRDWRMFLQMSAAMKREEPTLADDIDALVRASTADAVRIAIDGWPDIERQLVDRTTVRLLAQNEALLTIPDLDVRLARIEDEMRRTGVTVRIEVTGAPELTGKSPGAVWRQALESVVAELLPEHRLLREWPFKSPPPRDLPAMSVSCEVLAQQFVDPLGNTVAETIPVIANVAFATRGRALETRELDGEFVLGPIEVIHPDAARRARLGKSRDEGMAAGIDDDPAFWIPRDGFPERWRQDEIQRQSAAARAEIVRLLREELGLVTADDAQSPPEER